MVAELWYRRGLEDIAATLLAGPTARRAQLALGSTWRTKWREDHEEHRRRPLHGERTKGRQGRGQSEGSDRRESAEAFGRERSTWQRRPQKAPARARASVPHRRHKQRRPSEQSQSWGSLIASLVTSTLGRAILADVLEAAAAALKKERPGLEQAGADQIARAGEAATSAGSEIVSGTAALAQRAVSVLTEAAAERLSIALKGMAADDRKNLKGIARRA